MNFRELAEKTESYIIEQRRFFHACPELSMQEKETTKAIIAQLEAMGLEVKTFDGYYGCMADIVGGQPGKMVALRADIDALPIKEETGLPFASKNEGCMHACGHDCHISMLLGAAKMLTEVKDQLKGTVRLIFQPSEEAGSYDGAAALNEFDELQEEMPKDQAFEKLKEIHCELLEKDIIRMLENK